MSQPSDAPWDSYLAFVGEHPLVVDFQVDADDPDLRAALPALLRVQLEVVAPDEVGQPCPLEERQLDHEQVGLAQLLERHKTGARVVARATCRGGRDLVLALPESGLADFALRKWSRKLERECQVAILEEGWSFVDEHLLPGPSERDWMAARDALLAAAESGGAHEPAVTLIIEGRAPVQVPRDPMAVAAELTAARGESGEVLEWRLQ